MVSRRATLVEIVGGQTHFLGALRSSRELAALLLMLLLAAAALVALWLIILRGRQWIFVRPQRRNAIVCALFAGLAAAGFWFSRLEIPPHDAGARKASQREDGRSDK